jgi:hypothetical protein
LPWWAILLIVADVLFAGMVGCGDRRGGVNTATAGPGAADVQSSRWASGLALGTAPPTGLFQHPRMRDRLWGGRPARLGRASVRVTNKSTSPVPTSITVAFESPTVPCGSPKVGPTFPGESGQTTVDAAGRQVPADRAALPVHRCIADGA